MSAGRLNGRRAAVAVSGGIAAYKAIECIRLLTEADAEVRVLMTPEATRFVTPLTFEALSGHPVAADWLAATGGGETHIKLAEWAEVIAVVPATANDRQAGAWDRRRDRVGDRAGEPRAAGDRPGDE
jgi:phosphopantothenoylcysteine decarboxylase / phosphopantothenate---cysteine ligase